VWSYSVLCDHTIQRHPRLTMCCIVWSHSAHPVTVTGTPSKAKYFSLDVTVHQGRDLKNTQTFTEQVWLQLWVNFLDYSQYYE
jgi:hypothetical protein